ncbi:MAG: helix-turn-helix domain-containing protein, partial [Dehalococcoidia bacterium]|nr:helix-turn-helix domain-containing protein [Dehalococcoidia bacterium]
MTDISQPDDKTRWLPLGDARRLLAVSQATLRQWADGGYLRVYRTPGGHRRFLRDDVEAFFQGKPPGPDSEKEEALEGLALRR